MSAISRIFSGRGGLAARLHRLLGRRDAQLILDRVGAFEVAICLEQDRTGFAGRNGAAVEQSEIRGSIASSGLPRAPRPLCDAIRLDSLGYRVVQVEPVAFGDRVVAYLLTARRA